jgi:hypothetical protein
MAEDIHFMEFRLVFKSTVGIKKMNIMNVILNLSNFMVINLLWNISYSIGSNNNYNNSPFIVGVNFLRCLYPHSLTGTLVAT